ncbi:MAG TPA: hypothetical protein PKO23_09160 [Candidatus Hydrogenedentes bacterium]|nr:hypothetical protein [Candidatus Hydrogenedentota bacterium]HOH28797.1 hypothetical protein [Candidatus Hydrogenedentota bacterium]
MQFDTANIPEDIEVTPLNTVLEVTHIYFLYAMGWLWRIFGVSAWVGALYAGLMRACSASIVYGLFRLVLGRFTSMLGILILFSAPMMIDSAIELRDFGKAPFILGFLLVAFWLMQRKSSWRILCCSAALLGGWLGIGLGFRQDVLACLPPAAFLVLFGAKPASRHPWMVRGGALCLFVVFFGLTAYPIIQGIALEGGQAPLHAFFHGISPESEARLDFGGASYDSLISVDPAAFAIVNVYARRSGNYESMVNEGSAEYRRVQGDHTAPLLRDPYIYFTGAVYGRYANEVIWEMLKTYPADIVARAWRSVFSIHTVPEVMCDDMQASAVNPPRWLGGLLTFHDWFSEHLACFGLLYTGLALIVISFRHFWLAVYIMALFAFFAGYATLWYETRHIFFLAFFPVLAMILCVDRAIRLGWTCSHADRRRVLISRYIRDGKWKIPFRNGICFVFFVAMAILIPIGLLRVWQTRQVYGLAEQLAQTHLDPVEVTRTSHKERLHVSPIHPLPGLVDSNKLPPGETAWAYVAAVFDTQGEDIMVTLHYDDAQLIYNFTQDICIQGIEDGAKGRVTLFFPIYEADMNYGGELMAKELLEAYPDAKDVIDDSRPVAEQEWWRRGQFRGISFPERFDGTFRGFYHVQNIGTMSLLPIFQLPEDMRFLRPYKTGPWERQLRGMPPLPMIYGRTYSAQK